MAVSNKTYYGSGTIYEFKKPQNFTMPSGKVAIKAFVEANATKDNQVGYLKNGFQINISTNTLSDKSDLGEMKVDLITDETGTLTFSLFNANGATISRLYATANTTTEGVTTVGGLANADQPEHVLLFVAADKTNGQTVVIATGKNTAGFDLNWNPSSVQPFQCQYALTPFNTDGNLFRTADIENLPNLPIRSDTAYPIVYVMNDGEWAEGYTAPTSYVHDPSASSSADITLPVGTTGIVRGTDTFGGWYEINDIGTQVTTIDVSTETGSKTFIAKWTTG